jgi:predicted dehydrogenase/threonine dehydrogenase-like Zn-dependent dehydrogenase
MKQIIQDLKSGKTILEDIPVPAVRAGSVLIKTHRTLVSLGTERMLVEFGKANLLEKARQQPEKVKQVLDKVKTDGFQPTLEAVLRKLNEPMPLGYCQAGEVIAVGEGVREFAVGDRVVSNGPHAEVVCVPKNLVAAIPDGLSYDEAVFTVIGAIGLQGIRLINPSFGETVVVQGLGLIGLMAAELLVANGCEVIGFDFDAQKVALAQEKGVKAFVLSEGNDPVKIAQDLTQQVGVDAVLITASTKSNEVVSQAARMCRKRGRIVLVGVVGLELQRSEFYEKELSFQVSCSYGPGRYDELYEQRGQDYPIGFVRWTEKRNFEAILRAMASSRLTVKSLISEIIELSDYEKVYGDIGQTKSIATILRYPGDVDTQQRWIALRAGHFAPEKGSLGIIGAGNFAKATILPQLSKLKAPIKAISSAAGLSGKLVAKKFDIAVVTTDNQQIFEDPEIAAVVITTQHNTHARLVLEALRAGKHVFVEKPLAITSEEIDEIVQTYQQAHTTLTVGFNRRFSPFAQDAKKQLGSSNVPMHVVATMNAGMIPTQHWTQDRQIGGGRIIGEACHLIDLITFLTGSKVVQVVMNALGTHPAENTDSATILLNYENGSTGVVNYFANGSKAYAKERVEIYSQERTLVIDNFRKAEYFGCKSSGMSRSQDKGHYDQFRLFVERLREGGPATIPFDEIINTSRAALAAVESLKQGRWIKIAP